MEVRFAQGEDQVLSRGCSPYFDQKKTAPVVGLSPLAEFSQFWGLPRVRVRLGPVENERPTCAMRQGYVKSAARTCTHFCGARLLPSYDAKTSLAFTAMLE